MSAVIDTGYGADDKGRMLSQGQEILNVVGKIDL